MCEPNKHNNCGGIHNTQQFVKNTHTQPSVSVVHPDLWEQWLPLEAQTHISSCRLSDCQMATVYRLPPQPG